LKQNRVTLSIKLKPGAKRDALVLNEDGAIVASVTSPAIEGRANEHLIKLLSKALHISKSSCSMLQGAKSRFKVIAIEGVEKEKISNVLRNGRPEQLLK